MAELTPLIVRQRAAVRAALEAIGSDLAGEAARLAPIKEGPLRGSAHYEIVEEDGVLWVEVSFSTPYAARQHEEVSWQHPKGGQAKYLEQPFRERLPRYKTIVAAALERAT